ncbi:MAG: pentapeptide repeat-containing protein [Bacteroidota bacterium]
MQRPFICDTTYSHEDFTQNPLPKADYEECVFDHCLFHGGFLDNQNFMDCTFIECDFTNTNVKHTNFTHCSFEDCKMVGVSFEDCNPTLFSPDFKGCNLTMASFYGLTTKNLIFNACTLVETDFTEADLTGVLFEHCNLQRAVFQQSILDKADFRTAEDFSLDPEKNKLAKAKFSRKNLLGLLKKYDIVVT